MLAVTGSSELMEWFVFLRLEDERLHGAGEEAEPELVDAATARRLIGAE